MRRRSDEEVLAALEAANWKPLRASISLEMSVGALYARRSLLEAKGHSIPRGSDNPGYAMPCEWTYKRNVDLDIRDGCILAGSDMHVWPTDRVPIPRAWEAFCLLSHTLNPKAIFLNGDILDGARVSRHRQPLGSRAPKLQEEIDAFRLEYLPLLKPGIPIYWSIGNHDQRIDNYLADHANELADYAGRLSDRFPTFTFAYTFTVNGHTEITHRYLGGIHAARNNALQSGINFITGHTHQQGWVPVPNRLGCHYGSELGMLADRLGPQFEYTENNPNRCTEGFGVFTFDDEGTHLPPEMCKLVGSHMRFRNTKLDV